MITVATLPRLWAQEREKASRTVKRVMNGEQSFRTFINDRMAHGRTHHYAQHIQT